MTKKPRVAGKIWPVVLGLLVLIALLAPFLWDRLTEADGPIISEPATAEAIGLRAFYGGPDYRPVRGRTDRNR